MIVIRRKMVAMVSTENAVLGSCIALAIGIFIALSSFTEIGTTLILGIVILIGVILPQLAIRLLP